MTALLIILQILFYVWVYNVVNQYSRAIHYFALVLSLFLSIYILGLKGGKIDVKMPWVILILFFPVFGSLFYFLFRNQKVRKKIRKNVESQIYATSKITHDADDSFEALKSLDKAVYNQSQYIFKTTNMPIYDDSTSKYFPCGEEYYVELIKQLQEAKRFIFIEYFILKEGIMWDTVLNILKVKAEKGVDVRVIYDDFGCINTLPQNYKKTVESLGIKCEVFNPIYPVVTLAHNNRDHRKIVVIDGKVGFTGGINLSDEYINKWERFGHWKDTGIMIKGSAVKSFTLMFLETWHIYRDKDENIEAFLPETKKEFTNNSKQKRQVKSNVEKEKHEFIQPYMSTPMETEEIVARNVYVNILNSANNYVYITTPYLILDPELEEALINCAKRSVDVRIIVPAIPDKKLVFAVTRSNYATLLRAGIRIFEYTPGFIHAKNVVCDDRIATVGSINFDNRSFYHSYENGVFLFNSPSIKEILDDFIKTQKVSYEVENDYESKIPLSIRIKTSLLKLLSPLL
jgi:cardiolipin synthase